jgi:O-methyltransferase domain
MKHSLVEGAVVDRLLLLSGALRAGLIDALAAAETSTAEEVSGRAETDTRATRIVLEALAGEGVVETLPAEPGATQDGGVRYRLSEVGREHLLPGEGQSERFSLMHQVNKIRGWLDLPEVIRTGRPAPRDPAKRDVRTLVGAMGERDPSLLSEIVERCLAYSGPVRTMLDVGGAVGHVARHFSRCGVRATLLDREDVMPYARDFLGDDGREIALVAGDFTESLPAGPFDLVYLGNVLHIYGPSTNARVCGQALSSLVAGGTIAVQDYVWGRSPRAARFAVNMLQATEEGGVWTEAEYRGWLAEAGFVRIEVLDLETAPVQLILGTRPRV